MLMLFSCTWPHGSICNGYLLFNRRIIFKKLKFSLFKKKEWSFNFIFNTQRHMGIWQRQQNKDSNPMSSTTYQWAVSICQFPKLLIISKPKKKAICYPTVKCQTSIVHSLRKRLEYWTQIVKICSVIRLCTPFNCTCEHYSSYLSHHYTNNLQLLQ